MYGAIQLTWGIIQSALGFFVFLRHSRDPHSFYHGSILTKWKFSSGLSLGIFIFAPIQDRKNGERLIVHEYGHTIQSLILGPLYIPLIGIPSFTWAKHRHYIKKRELRGLSYSHYWTEKWADRLGELATGRPSLNSK
ncbi:MAG: hypothetical protein SCL54_00810 [Bacillota bacterium]|nr:hypothetical protein [Bacillota bacterium]